MRYVLLLSVVSLETGEPAYFSVYELQARQLRFSRAPFRAFLYTYLFIVPPSRTVCAVCHETIENAMICPRIRTAQVIPVAEPCRLHLNERLVAVHPVTHILRLDVCWPGAFDIS